MQQYYKRTFAEPQEYKGIKFRSKMECDFAKFLDGKLIRYKGVNYIHSPIAWVYEQKEYELIPQKEWYDKTEIDKKLKRIKRNKKHTLQKVIYTPDFYLPDYDLLVEIKGFQFDDATFRLRLRLFKDVYPDCAIWVVTSHTDFDKIDEVLEALKINGGNE